MGGATLSFLTLLDFVKKKGDDPIVIIPDNNFEFIQLLKAKNISFHVVPLRFHCYPPKNFGNWARCILFIIYMLYYEAINKRKICKIIKKLRPSIIHTNVGPLATGHFAAQKNGIPHIWHIREYGDLCLDLRFFPSQKKFHRMLSKDFVISVTKDLIKYNKQENNQNASVVYDGVRDYKDIHYTFPKEKFFLCASRISPEKAYSDIIVVFSKFHKLHPEYKLIILGDGNKEYIDFLKKMSFVNDCSDSILFEGFKTNVSDYMQKATALLVGTEFEGFGRMTAEACFDGCIVIGKNSGGTREIISQTGGFLYDTQEEMLGLMETVAKLSEDKYHSIAKKAQQTAQNLFSIENYTEKIYSIYTRALRL